MSSTTTPQMTAAYLAGIFDDGLSVQVARNGKTSWRVRLSKTSQHIGLPVTLHEKSNGIGTLFETKRGTRWCVESQSDVRQFLEQVQPFVEIRAKEVDILLELLNTKDVKEVEELVFEWKKVRDPELR